MKKSKVIVEVNNKNERKSNNHNFMKLESIKEKEKKYSKEKKWNFLHFPD